MSVPDIVLIMTDQQRADLVAREGYPLDTMPFCDALAREGQWFNRAYTPIPVCLPARTATLTGRFPSANRVRSNQHRGGDAVTAGDLVTALRAAGYRCALAGKNHSHLPEEHFDAAWPFHHARCLESGSEDERAFDRFLQASRMHLVREPTPFPLELQYPYRIVDHAIDWIERDDERPSFLRLSFPEPHNPYQVPTPYYDLFPPEALPAPLAGPEQREDKGTRYHWNHDRFTRAFPDFDQSLDRARSNYHGMLRMIDDQIQRFVTHLERTGRRENTLLIVCSDHGDLVGEYGLMRKGTGLDELLTRVPLIINGPGVAPRSDPNPAYVSLVDLLPTCCAAAGATPLVGTQGRDLMPLLRGELEPDAFAAMIVEDGYGGTAVTPDAGYDSEADGFNPAPDATSWGSYDCVNSVTQSGTRRALLVDDWKLVAENDGSFRLYDLGDDPRELCDRFEDPACAQRRDDLLRQLVAWMLRLDDPLPLPAHRYSYRPQSEICL